MMQGLGDHIALGLLRIGFFVGVAVSLAAWGAWSLVAWLAQHVRWQP